MLMPNGSAILAWTSVTIVVMAATVSAASVVCQGMSASLQYSSAWKPASASTCASVRARSMIGRMPALRS